MPDKKLTSYQKLKVENRKLKQDIFYLVREENRLSGISTKAIYSMIFDSHDAMMFGSRHPGEKFLSGGFSSMIKQP